jgi:uncharacterized membrane protein YfcA
VNPTLPDVLLLVAAGVLGGAVNAAAGGGSLLTFPALMAAGLPALTANVTNTVALCFGYAGGAAAFRNELDGDHARVRRLAAAGTVGALGGVALLDVSSPETFQALVPWLLVTACALLGAQPLVTRRLAARRAASRSGGRPTPVELSQVLAGAYGAYFGAGMGLMVLALLGISTGDSLKRLNALKSVVVLVVNITAAVCFVLVAPVAWWAVAVLGPASLFGGRAGAALAKRLRADVLRACVITIGLVVAIRQLV